MNRIVFFLVLIMFFAGCEQKDRIENVEGVEDIIALDNVAQQNMRLEGGNDSIENFQVELNKLAERDTLQIPGNIDIAQYRIYVSENGGVEKVDLLHNFGEPYVTDVNNIKKINNWLFAPYEIEGKKRKVKFDFIFMPRFRSYDLFDYLISPEEETIFDKSHLVEVSELPKIIGGIRSLAENIKYPEIAKRAGIQGSVFIKAYIDTAGSVVKMKVMRGIGFGCDLAALKAVSKAKFTPALENGKRVKVQVSIPIKFKLS